MSNVYTMVLVGAREIGRSLPYVQLPQKTRVFFIPCSYHLLPPVPFIPPIVVEFRRCLSEEPRTAIEANRRAAVARRDAKRARLAEQQDGVGASTSVAMEGDTRSSDDDFEAAAGYSGPRAGKVFKKDGQGFGYYRDRGVALKLDELVKHGVRQAVRTNIDEALRPAEASTTSSRKARTTCTSGTAAEQQVGGRKKQMCDDLCKADVMV